MKKLFNLKEWLTIADSAQYLSTVLEEEVNKADVLRLALDGHLTISVNFVNHAFAQLGKIVPIESAKLRLIPSDPLTADFSELFNAVEISPNELSTLPDDIKRRLDNRELIPSVCGEVLNETEVIEFSDNFKTITGVWDLMLVGSERLDVEHEYQQLTNGPAVNLTNLSGTFVKSADGEVAKIQESWDKNEFVEGSNASLRLIRQQISTDKVPAEKAEAALKKHEEARNKYLQQQQEKPISEQYYPAGGLPDDGVLVVRTSALREFEESLEDKTDKSEKPITPTERNSLLVIIAALCSKANIDWRERGAAGRIARLTETNGTELSDDTVRRALKRLEEALDLRAK